MANPRVHEIASEHGIESRIVLRQLKVMGEFVKGPSSSVAPPVARRVSAALEAQGHSRVVKFGAGFQPTAGSLVAHLPRSIPALIDLIIESNQMPQSVWHRAFARAAATRHFYFAGAEVAPKAFGVAAEARALFAEDLPSPAGVLIIAEQPSRVRLVGWSEERALEIVSVSLRGTGRNRVSSAGVQYERMVAEDDVYVLSPDGRPGAGALLGGVLSLVPDAEEGTANATRDGGISGGPQRVVEAGGVRLVLLVRPGERARGIHPARKRESRWKVRGHFRNQWYPSLGTHRRVWIEDHFAGPEDGRPISHETVKVIRG